MVWALLGLGLGGVLLAIMYKNKLAAPETLPPELKSRELKDLDQLLEESVLVKEDLERLLVEATRVSSKIQNELSGQIEFLLQLANDEKIRPLSWSESPDQDNSAYKNVARQERDRTSRRHMGPSQNCLKPSEVNRGRVVVTPVQWVPLENPETDYPQIDENRAIAGSPRMDSDLFRPGTLEGMRQKRSEEREKNPANSVTPLYPAARTQTSQSSSYDQICRMADEGYSALRIAETTGIGLGEVQLVLDIYRKNRFTGRDTRKFFDYLAR
ncbi:MAG: DUF2802 domain-containing protein [Syntrophomonadaceae bacterium]|nr:DUF2802 domain-containing protein [Syntrophomonadaceae bacterium]